MSRPPGSVVGTSASIEFLFAELPLVDRVAAAAQAGFQGVEFWDWRTKEMDRLADAAAHAGVVITGFFGNRRYSLIDRTQHAPNLDGLAESLACARRVGCPAVHAFVQEIRQDGTVVPPTRPLAEAEAFENAVEGLRQAAALAQAHGVVLLLEAINPVSVPGYFLDTAEKCLRLVEAVDHPSLAMTYDYFHQQQAGGNLMATLERCHHRVAAVHVADVPGRHEPGTGEINFVNLNRHLHQLGFDGTLVFEVKPRGTSGEAVRAIHAIFADRFPRREGG
ncbi:MAG: TIM barrel protein [Armatimonadota bacterium]|nr:TIM barrel protein [Armatimonadota bacterium]MDR7448295.1 TIM barrel protein [Armatimonadota bacterium]MDR7458324.1 TIM barrel protein [Armatimonadota bacterium]MDR7478373.1 TIM barrel protein [Armatimonadota bacterium]MDR7487307.1 TIM barrel protein [Armatimonadota bacterium]